LEVVVERGKKRLEEIEPEAWKGLEELRGALRRRLRRHCRDENELEDVVQDTFLRAARYRSRLRESGRLRAWALRIGKNVATDRHRRGSSLDVGASPEEREEGAVPEPAARAAEQDPLLRIGRYEVAREDAAVLLGDELQRMRADDRAVLSSYYQGPESCRATAEECGIPYHLVKIRLFRARRRLCRALRHRVALDFARVRPGALEGAS